MLCIFTARAEEDLENIADYIAIDNPARAISFVQEIKNRCHRIANAPQGFPLAPEYGENVRKVPYGNYLILYMIHENNIVILHITHGARNINL